MGILNVTPDSFSDGGLFNEVQRACDRAMEMVDEGADMIDIGGESTRPGSERISVEQECARVLPVIEKVAARVSVPISIDSTKSEVVSRAFDAGASWINDVSGGRFDPELIAFAGRRNAAVIVMHSRHTPKTMQQSPSYEDVVAEVSGELDESVSRYLDNGVSKDRIVIDPGIGFGKRVEDNLRLLAHTADLLEKGYDVCIGASRKSFIGKLNNMEADKRLYGSVASLAQPFLDGARFFRVHDVEATCQFLRVMHAIRESGSKIA